MARRVMFVLTILAVIAGSAWAIRPTKEARTLHSLSTRGIITSPPGTREGIGSSTYPIDVDGDKTASIRNTSEAWNQFVLQTGGRWSVRWNPVTGTPHLVTGRPLSLPGATKLMGDNIKTVCLNFVSANSNLLKVKPHQLRMANAVKAGGRWYVSFRQTHRGIPVLGGKLTMSFTKDDRLIMFGSDVYPEPVVETIPKLDKKKALSIARTDCQETAGNDRFSSVDLCILPVRRPERLEYVLCWQLYIYQPMVQKKWHYLIDAVNGNIIRKSNVLVYENITGTVEGEYKPEFGSDPTQVVTFPHEDVSARGPESIIAAWNLDTNPGWSTEGQWAFGIPMGGGGELFGNPDPTSGHTGSNVYGVNLGGDYDLTGGGLLYLTTGPINCSGHSDVWLKFWRWLNTDYQPYTWATVEVSNNGTSWTTFWENGSSIIADSSWSKCSYDISSVADNQPTVYIRWGYNVLPGAWQSSGWNIDDVKIVIHEGGINTVQTETDGSYSVPPPWNPCTITSELEGLYCNIHYGCGNDSIFEESGVAPGEAVDFVWNSSWYNEVVEPSVYWHVNYVHDYYLALDPSLSAPSGSFPSGMNYQMPVVVQLGCPFGYCNAYWDGEGMAFGAGDGSYCDDFGLYAEVVYHEYTHGVTNKIYDGILFPYAMESGAMNEGWSDYFGCGLSPSQNHFVGDGGLLLGYPQGFRTLDNTYRRETDFYNEVHFDSQMFSGGLWEARQIIGASVMDEMVHFARYAHAQTFEEYILAILIEDDTRYGNNDLSNGTPHGQTIYTAFGNHGMGGLQYMAPSIVIDDASGNADGKLDPGETADLSVTLINGWADATNVSAVLGTIDPFVTIVKDVANFPAPNHGDLVNNAADPFIILLDSNCPETHTVNFTLVVAADGPYNYSRTCLFTYPVAVKQSVYDDGQVDSYLGFGLPGCALAVRVTPETYPCYPTHVRLFTNPFESAPVTVTIWDDDGPDGTPGTILGSVDAYMNDTNDWFDVDISTLALIIDSDSFYVGWVEGSTVYYNGIDMDPPYYERSWAHFYIPPFIDEWVSLEDIGLLANLMVRVRYSDECPFFIEPPYEYSWPLNQPVSDCLGASNGTEPYYDWIAIPLPPGEYTWSVLGSSLFSASGIGQGWNDDDNSWNYTLPFLFPYSGSIYTSVNVCSNGFIDFENAIADCTNSTVELIENVRIAPLWDDLRTDQSPSDDIYIDESIAGQVTIRWQGSRYGSGEPVNFAVILFDDGNIRFDYDGGNTYLSPTVGTSAGNGMDYIIVPGYDEAVSLTNVNSVLFTPPATELLLPPGISLNPDTGCFEGIPAVIGNYSAIIQVTDSSMPQKTAQHRFDFNIHPCPLPPAPSNPVPCDGAIEVPTDTKLSWSDGCSDFSDSSNVDFEEPEITPQLPTGFSFRGGVLVKSEEENETLPAPAQVLVASSLPVGTTLIDFDDIAAPYRFVQTVRLTDMYELLGVVFEGPGGNDGGAILNECSNFGVSGHLSPNFLAFNIEAEMSDGGIPQGSETLHFNPSVSSIQLLASSGYWLGQVTLQAFNADGSLLDSSTITLSSAMTPIAVSSTGISRVVVSSTSDAFVIDDLTFSPEDGNGPEYPTTWDVYFGTDPAVLELICEDLNEPNCDPTPELGDKLNAHTTYYWRVVAKNSCGEETQGDNWSFTTGNAPPVANAGDDQTAFAWIDGIADVTLNGSNSNDPDGDELTYRWMWIVGEETFDADGVTPTINLPVGIHTVTLIVNDGTENSEPDEVVITVVPPLEVRMHFTPQAINPKSKGKWDKAHLDLPRGFSVDDVNVNEPGIIEPLGVTSEYMKVFANENNLVKVEMGFNRDDFCCNGSFDGTVMAVGKLSSSQYFYGTDTIKVLDKIFEAVVLLSSHWLDSNCSHPDWCNGTDVDQDSLVNFRDFTLFDGCCVEVIKD